MSDHLPDAGKMVRIPAADLPRMIGKPIHLAWANKGCVWMLDRIDGDTIHLRAPKTHRAMSGRSADACYTRRHQPDLDRKDASNG